MTDTKNNPELQPLVDINQLIHAPARLMILAYLYVVETADYVFLLNLTGLTWGNLSSHLGKLEEAGYIVIKKDYRGKKPHSTVSLSERGRGAFGKYKRSMQKVLDDLPD